MTLTETDIMLLLLTVIVLFVFVKVQGLFHELKYSILYFVFDKKQCHVVVTTSI